MFKSSTCYGRACCFLGKSKAKYILWREGKGESKDPPLRRRGNRGKLPNRQLALALLLVL